MAPFYGWVSIFLRLLSHYQERVYFLPLSSQKFLVFDQPWKDVKLSRSCSHTVVLNPGPLDQESSTLITRPLLHSYLSCFKFSCSACYIKNFSASTNSDSSEHCTFNQMFAPLYVYLDMFSHQNKIYFHVGNWVGLWLLLN